MSSASSRHFHEQQRIAQSQMNLRTAAAQIRRDFSRAGYLGSPNTVKETVCPDAAGTVDAAATDFGAIEVLNGEATTVLAEASTNGVEADTVRLTGNFASGDAYKVAGTQTSTTSMELSGSSPAAHGEKIPVTGSSRRLTRASAAEQAPQAIQSPFSAIVVRSGTRAAD